MRTGILKKRLAFLVIMLGVATGGRLFGQPAPPPAPGPAPAISIGIYISSIFDIYPEQSSFLADFTVWTNQKGNEDDPLDNLAFPREREYQTVYQSRRMIDGVQWSLRRYRATFLHDWILKDFPFDKHRLQIQLCETNPLLSRENYVPDTKNSGLGRHLDLAAWGVSDFRIQVKDVRTDTTLGNPVPGADPLTFTWITATVLVKRDAPWVFLKLVMGGYVALAAALIACMMKAGLPPLFSGRMVVQISSLFAALLSNRAADFALGRVDQFTLPNLIHLIIYIMIFSAMIVTLRSRVLCERDQEVKAVSFERRASLILAVIFVILNVALIWRAALSPVLDS